MITRKKYKYCLTYIKNYWNKLIFYLPKDQHLHFGLPNKYVIANHEIFNKDQFYWDSFFIILGLVKSGKVDLARGIVENFAFLYKRFSIMPMRNRYYNLGTSQIPFYSSMIREVFNQTQDKHWLKKHMLVAEEELHKYWMNEKLTERHLSYKGLSRYCDHYITHLGAEHESGWDMTSRFHNHCLDYLPIDLNTCLYKYEKDLAFMYGLMNNPVKQKFYLKQSARRKKNILALMWDEKTHFFYDFNYKHKRQNKFKSVAGFYPLWAKLATKEQAKKIRQYVLPEFEYEGGITNTQDHGLSEDIKQHDHPNGWPQHQWIVVRGLLNYGYREDAERIAGKWLDMNDKVFHETGKFWEKYNVVKCETGVYNPERYVTQSGFGWTNSIFVRLISELEETGTPPAVRKSKTKK